MANTIEKQFPKGSHVAIQLAINEMAEKGFRVASIQNDITVVTFEPVANEPKNEGPRIGDWELDSQSEPPAHVPPPTSGVPVSQREDPRHRLQE